MSNSIPQTFIDELLTRTDIVEVIEIYVTLQKAGRDYKACCPFHQEKTPSFTVSPQKQFYYCFGCGAHGNAIKFLMEHQHLSFVEAIEHLAQRAGLTVPTSTQKFTPAQTNKRDNLFTLLERVAQFYRHQLKHHAQKDIAIDYLRKRGLTGAICQRFGIGFAPPGRDNLLRYFHDIQDQLMAAGMLSEKAAKQFQDRFRNRIMFPIRDRQGRVIAFGGRVLDDATPKYLNSPETTIFHKSQELYGLYEVLQQSTKIDKLVVVEGYMDVVALAQFDISYAVATLGTALNAQHLRRLFRLVNRVIFCFDGDAAGKRAAWRALEHCLPIAEDEREIFFLFLPSGDDPDSYVRREGKDGFEQALNHATPLTHFLLQHLLAQVDLSNLDGKAKLVKLAQPLINQLPEGARRALLWEQLTITTGLSLKEIKKLCAIGTKQLTASLRKPINIKLNTTLTPIQRLISLLIQYPALVQQIPEDLSLSSAEKRDADILLELLSILRSQAPIHTGILLEHWNNTEYAHYLVSLAAWEHLLNSEQLMNEVAGILECFKLQSLEQHMHSLLTKVTQVGLEGLTAEEKTWLRSFDKSRF